MKKLISFATVVALAITVGAPFKAANSLDVAGHFSDKRITILIPYGPGGTYDKYGSTFARHLGNHIPGKPTVIVQHMPGAGGSKAMRYAYNVMQKQGYHMIVPLDNTVVNKLMRPKLMRYTPNKFNWMGSSNQTNVILVIRSDSGVKKFEDMQRIPVIGGTSGKSSSGFITPMIIKGLFGAKIKMITGYKGSSRSILAIEQGETQMAAFNWLAWDSKVPHWFKGKNPFARAIVQVGMYKDPDLPDVPMIDQFLKEKDKPVVEFLKSSGPIGRGLTLPPGVKKSVIGALRKAYDGMNGDPKFAKELKKRRLRLIASSGKTIQDIVEKAMTATSPAVIKRAKKLIFAK